MGLGGSAGVLAFSTCDEATGRDDFYEHSADAVLRMVTTALKKTDRRRWADSDNLFASWEPRNKQLAALVPKNTRVIEFGAGKRVLERYLDPSCTYVPSDVVDRGPGTILCDLNERPLPSLDGYDVAVLSGVLEYVRDVPSMLDWLTQLVGVCVLTYAPAKANGYSPWALLDRFSPAAARLDEQLSGGRASIALPRTRFRADARRGLGTATLVGLFAGPA